MGSSWEKGRNIRKASRDGQGWGLAGGIFNRVVAGLHSRAPFSVSPLSSLLCLH